MHYIIMDLEWNQPLSYASSAYKSVGGKLIFELIQIGAIKMSETLQIEDSFTQLIHPVHYSTLHPRIKRITHITQDEVDNAPVFAECMQRFSQFCGDDYVLVTWGCDDVSVLEQNKRFFKCNVALSPVYDMQRVYGEMINNTKERQGLSAAMEHFSINPDEEKPFHNALNDAYYTALVLQHFPDPKKILEYPLEPKLLHHTPKRKELKNNLRFRSSMKNLLVTPSATNPPCPVCGHKTQILEAYLKTGDNEYTALAECPQHGLFFSTIRKAKTEGKSSITRTTVLSKEQDRAYIETKRIQWKNKLAQQLQTDDVEGNG